MNYQHYETPPAPDLYIQNPCHAIMRIHQQCNWGTYSSFCTSRMKLIRLARIHYKSAKNIPNDVRRYCNEYFFLDLEEILGDDTSLISQTVIKSTPKEISEAILGDIYEHYNANKVKHGKLVALIFLARELFSIIRPWVGPLSEIIDRITKIS